MRISVQSHEYSGDPKDPRREMERHLVQSAYLVQDQFLKLVINFDDAADLQCTSSTPNSIGFIFEQDQEWQGSYETEVHIIGETPDEIELIKRNQFRQDSKGQLVVALLPWSDSDDGVELASWDNVSE